MVGRLRPVPNLVGRRSAKRQEELAAWGLVLPIVILMLVFVGVPVVGALALSLFSWTGLTDPSFIGIANYARLLSDVSFRDSLLNTVSFATLYVGGIYAASLGLALLVNGRLRGSGVLRSMYFVPVAVSPAVAALLWTLVFDERSGILNGITAVLGWDRIAWLGSTQFALFAVAVVAVWQAVGFAMIIQLAGLQDIPREYYEAAAVDGASGRTTFLHITLPLLKPTSAFVIITALIDGFTVFDIVYVMTHGGPANSTTTVVYNIFKTGFQRLEFGYAAAQAVLLFAILFVLSFGLLRLFRQERAEEAWT